MGLTLGIVLVALVLFVWEPFPVELTALLAAATLVAGGVLTANEGFGGFGDPAVITVGAMCVLASGLTRTGALTGVSGRLEGLFQKSFAAGFVALLWLVGGLSAFLNNTACVALFLPVTFHLARVSGRSVSRLLIPLSYAAILGGTCTLVGTSTNLVVNSVLVSHHLEPFGLFEFSRLGLISLGLGVVYLAVVGVRLLPDRRTPEPTESPQIEVALQPHSPLVGSSLAETSLSDELGGKVVAVHHHHELVDEQVEALVLEGGDTLVLDLPQERLPSLRVHPDLVMLSESAPSPPRRQRMWLAIFIFLAVLALSTSELVPLAAAATLGAVAMVASGCLTIREAYQGLELRVLMMIGASLALGVALEKSGAAPTLARFFSLHLAAYGPQVMLAGVYLLTMLMTEVLSNTATAALVSPVAIALALEHQLDPRPFLVAVTFAASASFMTPLGYQTNTMVYGSGHYRFTDFLKVGLPLNFTLWVVASSLIPRWWPAQL